MAKAAKHKEVEITERMATKFRRDILERFENIESARGKFMNIARRERDAMTTIYESLAAAGVPQKAARTNIKIIRALERIKGWMADLEADERKMAQKLARAQDDKRQLSLFTDLPKPTKAERKAEQTPKLELVEKTPDAA
jgi:hypothetical protein